MKCLRMFDKIYVKYNKNIWKVIPISFVGQVKWYLGKTCLEALNTSPFGYFSFLLKHAMIRKLFFYTCLFSCLLNAFAQGPPKSANKLDRNGMRTGKWVIWMNGDWDPTENVDSLAYYRQVSYKKGDPVGPVTDHFLDGTVQMSAQFKDTECKVMHGEAYWFDSLSRVSDYKFFQNGELDESKTAKGRIKILEGEGSPQIDSISMAEMSLMVAKYFLLKLAIDDAQPYARFASEVFKRLDPEKYVYSAIVMGPIYQAQDEWDLASQQYEIFIPVIKMQYGELNPTYISVLELQAQNYYNADRYDQSIETYQLLLKLQDQTSGKASEEYAKTLERLAKAYSWADQKENAIAMYKHSMAIRQELKGANHDELAEDNRWIAYRYEKMEDYSEALNYYLLSKTYLDSLPTTQTNRYRKVLEDLADVYTSLEQNQEAFKCYEAAYALRKKLKLDDAEDQVEFLFDATKAGVEADEYQKSLELNEEAAKIIKKEFGTSSLLYVRYLNSQGHVYAAQGAYEQNVKGLEKALALYLENEFEDLGVYSSIVNNLAVAYYGINDLKKAEQFGLESVEVMKQQYGKDHLRYSISLNNLGVFYNSQKRSQEAYRIYQKVYQIRKSQDSPNLSTLATVTGNLGVLHQGWGDYDSAEYYMKQSLQYNQVVYGLDHLNTIRQKIELADLYANSANFKTADSLYTDIFQYFDQVGVKNHQQHAYFLDNYASFVKDKGKYREALDWYQKAGEIAETYLSAQNSIRLKIRGNTGLMYKQLGFYQKADAIYSELLEESRGVYGEESSYADLLVKKAILAMDFKEYEKAYLWLVEADSIGRLIYTPNHPKISNVMSSMTTYYFETGQLSKADSLNLITLEKRKKMLGENHPDYQQTLNARGVILSELGRLQESYEISKGLLAKQEALLGECHPSYAMALNNHASSCDDLGLYDLAEELYLKALNLREQVLGVNHPDYLNSLSNLAAYYSDNGDLNLADEYFDKLMNLARSFYGKENPQYATYLRSKASHLKDKGAFAEAERILLQVYEIQKVAYGADCYECVSTLTILGNLSDDLGRTDRSKAYYKQALAMTEVYYGTDHYEYATLLANYGNMIRSKKDFALGDSLFHRALAIDSAIYGVNHYQYTLTLSNFSQFYSRFGYTDSALVLSEKVVAIQQKILRQDHPSLAINLNNLGALLMGKNQYQEADSIYQLALGMIERTHGKGHDLYSTVLSNLAVLEQKKGSYYKAYKYWESSMQIDLDRLRMQFPVMSELEKKQFWETTDAVFEAGNSFAVRLEEDHHEVMGVAYNNLLTTKAILLNASSKMKKAVAAANDPELDSLITEWKIFRQELVKAEHMPGEKRKELSVNIKALKVNINTLEKQLSEKTNQLSSKDNRNITWKDVQAKLKPGEAAVEIVRFEWYDKQWTDSVLYAAYVVTSLSEYPALVVLPNGQELEKKYLKTYRSCIQYRIDDLFSYNEFWKPIKDQLSGIEKVYFSPDGVFNQVNLNTLKNPETGDYVLNETKIVLLTSTREVVTEHQNLKKKNKTAMLIGRPTYKMSKLYDLMSDRVEEGDGTSERGLNQRNLQKMFGSEIADLPGTEEEVRYVTDLLSRSGWEIESFIKENAEESVIKLADNPVVLHVATHGFFIPKSKKKNAVKVDPMLRSGILLAGVSDYYQGESDLTSDDGILTAYEASSLDLEETKLVILSACETGLGDLSSGEGVYGLQRGFEIAGAQNILMSLWKVDDEATKALMGYFYKEWLKSKDIREAFFRAQTKLRASYDHPYYWGAFVMVGAP